MALISKIRERSKFVLIFIGVALVAFIATDLLSNKGLVSDRPDNSVAIVGGEPVNYDELKISIDNFVRATRMSRVQQKQDPTISEVEMAQIQDQEWTKLLQNHMMGPEFEKLGIAVTGQEIIQLSVGQDYVHSFAVQNLGVGDPENKKRIAEFIQNLSAAPAEAQEQWLQYENGFIETRLKEKYNTLVNKGIFVTDLEVYDEMKSRTQTAGISYVGLQNNTIADSLVKITEDDYKKYYDSHKEKYKQAKSASVAFVYYPIIAGPADTAFYLNEMSRKVQALATAKSDSTLIVNSNGTVLTTTRGQNQDKALDSTVFNTSAGQMIGPKVVNGKAQLIKILRIEPDTAATYHAAHILIKWKGATKADSNATIKKMDSVYAVLKSGKKKFKDLAMELSEDGSSRDGGNLGWFKTGQMVSKFQKGVESLKNTTDIVKVQTEFGVHIIKQLDMPSFKKVTYGLLETPIVPTKQTRQTASNKADTFKMTANRENDFDKAVKRLNVNPRVVEQLSPASREVSGLKNARPLVQWAFSINTKVGDISTEIKLDEGIAIATLRKVREEGYQPLEEAKASMEAEVRKAKKLEMLAEKMKNAIPAANGNLENLAKALNSSVAQAEGLTFSNTFIPNLGNEPTLVGAVFGTKLSALNGPITGEEGVYYFKVTSLTQFNDPKPEDIREEAARQTEQRQRMAQNTAYQALLTNAKVVDNRYMHGM